MANKPENAKAHVDKLVQEATTRANDPAVDLTASSITQGTDDVIGKKPVNAAINSPNQRDFMPGSIARKDPTYIPSHAYDEEEQETRPVALKGDYSYVWVTAGTDGFINRFKNMGYRLCMYSGDPTRSSGGLAPKGFQGTNMFERDANNRVVNGDTVLMYCSHALHDAIESDINEQTVRMQRAATEDFHNRAHNLGVRSFEERTNPEEPGHPAERIYN